MRRVIRSSVLVAIVMLMTAAPSAAHASQQILYYKGHTSEGGPAGAYVLRKDSGRLVARAFYSGYDLTCSVDGTTQQWIVLFGSSPGWNLSDHRRVKVAMNDGMVAIHFNGRLAWAKGTGHTRLVVAQLTPDEQPQLCVSGWLGWDVKRHALPGGGGGSAVPSSKGFIHVVVRKGVPHVVAFRLPAGV